MCVHAFGHLELAGFLAVGAVGAADPGEAVAQGLLWEATEGTADLATPGWSHAALDARGAADEHEGLREAAALADDL